MIRLDQKWINVLTVALFALGLAARVAFMPTDGTTDLQEFVKWAVNTHDRGLSRAWQGAYFPVQYQSFSLSYSLAQAAHIMPDKAIRVSNLIFELGCLALLAYMLRRFLSPLMAVVLFWLNPFSLVMFQQGYVDAQFTFFVLLSFFVILSEKIPGIRKYLLAGLPLGLALLMKPQAVPLFAGVAVLAGGFFLLKQPREALKMLAIFVVPLILYLSYSLYFGLTIDIYKGHNTLPGISAFLEQKAGFSKRYADIGAGSFWLSAQYLYIPKKQPAINAYMANPWYFVAEALRPENVSLFRVPDTDKFLGVSYRLMGEILFALAFLAIAWKILRSGQTTERKAVLTLCVVPILVPYLVTSAHDNHFYLGFIGAIIIGALLRDKIILTSGYLLGALNGANILYWYVIPKYTSLVYDITTKCAIIGASSAVFLIFLYYLLFKADYKRDANIGTWA